MAAPGWLKSFAKKQKIGIEGKSSGALSDALLKQKIGTEGKSSGALSDAVRESVAVRTPVDVSAVDDYLADELIQVTHTVLGLHSMHINSKGRRANHQIKK